MNNSHPFRQNSGDKDDFIKVLKSKNDDHNEHFTKTPNIRNDDTKKQAKPPDIKVRNAHHKNPNRIEKA